jgi:hypothetical protein
MKTKKFLCVQAFVLALLCMGCSQHRVVSQCEFLEEASRLKPGRKISVRDRNGKEFKGALVEAANTLPDSSRVLVIANKASGEKRQYKISPVHAQTEIIQMKTRRKVNAASIATGAGIGTLGGTGLGFAIAHGEVQEGSELYGLAILVYTLIGSASGFTMGTVTDIAIPGNRTLTLKDEAGVH